MKRFLSLIFITLTACVYFTACGTNGGAAQPRIAVESPDSDVSEDDAPNNSYISKLSDLPTMIPEGAVRSELTNEFIAPDIADVRPIAVMIANSLDTPSSLFPLYNISQSGVLYEILTEAGISRFMAVIEDWECLDKIGNILSTRDYYVYLAYEWDAMLVHIGNPYYADEVLSRTDTDNINGNPNGNNGPVPPNNTFFRTTDRQAPHNWYTSGAGINEAIEKLNYSKTHTDYFRKGHYTFAPENEPNKLSGISGSKSAVNVDLSACYPYNKPYFEYNAEDELYYRFQFGKPHIDGTNQEQLAFKNIIIQNTYSEPRDKNGYQYYTVHDNTRDGYFVTNGKYIHIRWNKNENFDATKYYDDNGVEVVFNTGKTMVCVVSDGSSIIIE